MLCLCTRSALACGFFSSLCSCFVRLRGPFVSLCYRFYVFCTSFCVSCVFSVVSLWSLWSSAFLFTLCVHFASLYLCLSDHLASLCCCLSVCNCSTVHCACFCISALFFFLFLSRSHLCVCLCLFYTGGGGNLPLSLIRPLVLFPPRSAFLSLCPTNAKKRHKKKGNWKILKEWGQCICHGGIETVQNHSWINLLTWGEKEKEKAPSDRKQCGGSVAGSHPPPSPRNTPTLNFQIKRFRSPLM